MDDERNPDPRTADEADEAEGSDGSDESRSPISQRESPDVETLHERSDGATIGSPLD